MNKLAKFYQSKINEYQQQALDFLEKTNTTIDIKYEKFDKHFEDDTQKRDIYKITIKRTDKNESNISK